jgi:hypothetical protein
MDKKDIKKLIEINKVKNPYEVSEGTRKKLYLTSCKLGVCGDNLDSILLCLKEKIPDLELILKDADLPDRLLYFTRLTPTAYKCGIFFDWQKKKTLTYTIIDAWESVFENNLLHIKTSNANSWPNSKGIDYSDFSSFIKTYSSATIPKPLTTNTVTPQPIKLEPKFIPQNYYVDPKNRPFLPSSVFNQQVPAYQFQQQQYEENQAELFRKYYNEQYQLSLKTTDVKIEQESDDHFSGVSTSVSSAPTQQADIDDEIAKAEALRKDLEEKLAKKKKLEELRKQQAELERELQS